MYDLGRRLTTYTVRSCQQGRRAQTSSERSRNSAVRYMMQYMGASTMRVRYQNTDGPDRSLLHI